MLNYCPQNWYWIVGGSTTEVYASARATYVAVNDSAYTAWLAAGNVPTKISASDLAAIQAQIAIASGVNITSTGTPALNGTYSIDPTSQANLAATATAILVTGKFPGNQTTMPWIDAQGGLHTFNDTATFNAFASAIAGYVAAVTLYGQTGGAHGALLSNNLSIV